MPYNTKWEIYVYDINTGEKKLITDKENGRCQNPAFKPNDSENKLSYLYMLHYGLESDQLSLRIYTPSTENIEIETNPTKQMINSFIWDLFEEYNIFKFFIFIYLKINLKINY